MRLILPFLILCLCGCYAQRLELDDPMGLPLAQPQLGVQILSQNAPELAFQLQSELLQLLPRERQVQSRSLESASSADWSLTAQLQQQRQMLEVPLPLLNGLNAAPRVRLELKLVAELKAPGAQSPAQRWELVQRGDARPDAEAALAQELLRNLRDRLLREMQAKYQYK
ncbi:MAG: hypothetical protein ACAI44_24865 [Candidatus Sericytochromatia bacterium]